MNKKRVLLLANSDRGLYSFRRELVQELMFPGSYLSERQAEPVEVFIALPNGDRIPELIEMGCHFIETPLDGHGTNPFNEIKLLSLYIKIIKKLKPDMVFTYTIKPNLYGGIACRLFRTPCVVNITGLGTAVENGGIMQKLMLMLYKIALPGARKVFFQNNENEQFFTEHRLALGKHDVLPGSGVNLNYYMVSDYPSDETINFVFISRIMKEKGIEQYIEAAKSIREKYSNTRFHVCGACEKGYSDFIQRYVEEGTIVYHGRVNDIVGIHKIAHCIVHPTYYPEGMSNVLLEASASGRPIITTDRSGCREIVDDGINGFVVKQKDSADLIEKLDRFINLPYEQKKAMGLAGREKVEKQFDRKIVVKKYLEELKCVDR